MAAPRPVRKATAAHSEHARTGQDRDPRRSMVMPFARALALLGAFTPQERWLGNRDLNARTGLPASTVSRIAQSLVLLGYLRYEPVGRKYRLAPSVLALGYAAIANSDVQRRARDRMKAFSDKYKVHVSLSARDRLDLIVLEACSNPQAPLALNLHVGSRVGIAGSPIGWALLAALPDIERFYLLENLERRMAGAWPRMRRRLSHGVAQAHDKGFCASIGEWDHELAIVAAPLLIEGEAPLVLACVGAGAQLTRPRVERELAPRLIAMADALNQLDGVQRE
ncbi:MAG: IclR family transcriptional regulator [Burkholderiales bacterium]|nr:IclR family transcriptional regulator [Burkholderiales bacterium]